MRTAFAKPLILLVFATMWLPLGCQRAERLDDKALATGRVLDYRNGWYHMASGAETVQSVAALYMRDAGLVAKLNRVGPSEKPAAGTPLYIPPVHDLDQLEAVLKRINLNPEIVPQEPPPLHSLWAANSEASAIHQEQLEKQAGQNGAPPTASIEQTSARALSNVRFSWPLEGKLIRRFSIEGGSTFRGIAIQAGENNNGVRAAREGKVIYAGELKGYGNMVVVDHGDGYTTVYGYNERVVVKDEDIVRSGQLIAYAGRPSKSSPVQLFFQIRQNARPVDPLAFLQ